ncbi:MAG: hypothetical protein HY909_03480 [Deltaproteobacteria bacterium]|nr:hypothetical protein [Deltaproteobacteria bacterium]
MRARAVLALAALGASGCPLDFDAFRRPRVTTTPMDVAEVGPDTAPVDTAPPRMDGGCPLDFTARLRLAHMATGFPALDLCYRRNAQGTFSKVGTASWPVAGLTYGEVSALGPPGTQPARVNEPWEFVAVVHGAACTSTRVASLVVGLDPGSRATLILTSEPAGMGRAAGVLGVLEDKTCAECGRNVPEVRGVHGSFGLSSERLDLSLSYGILSQVFAQSVPYGGTAMNGNQGYACQNNWLGLVVSPTPIPVQLVARESRGIELARSERTALKAEHLRRTGRATFFIEGDLRGGGLGFVLCYDGVESAGLTTCDRIRATTLLRDAGPVLDARPSDTPGDALGDAWLDAATDPMDDLADTPGDAPGDAGEDAGGDAGAMDAGDAGDTADPTADDDLPDASDAPDAIDGTDAEELPEAPPEELL